MRQWLIDIFKISHLLTSLRNLCSINNKEIIKLVDRANRLEQTVQCLSDENQTLIAKLYSKEKNNG